jgi:carbon monoxide dehydrogenase subunit G
MKLDNEFVLSAPRSAVWAGLTNPAIAVPCMPGTEISERVGEHAFKAVVSLRVGPVKLQFRGDGQLANLSADLTYGELLAKGSDSKGRGSFKAEMKFRLSDEGENKTRVRVETELTLTGSVAQYGRGVGIVKEVASQLTREFTDNLESRVARPSSAGSSAQMPEGLTTSSPQAVSSEKGSSINLPHLILSSIWRWLRSRLGRAQ